MFLKERKKGKIIALCGISGSGKSTRALEIHNNTENSVILSRDNIRRLIFGMNDDNELEYYKDKKGLNKRENIITNKLNTLIYDSLECGETVILDSTNLRLERLEFLKYWNVETEIIFVKEDLDVCIERDSKRVVSVGEEKIKRQFDQFRHITETLEKEPIDFTPRPIPVFDESKKNVYIFDIDGTIAHKNDRNPFDMKAVDQDEIDSSTLFLFELLKRKVGLNSIILCSGRSEDSREGTVRWFEKNGIRNIKSVGMFFRSMEDKRPDWVVKTEMWDIISKERNIVGMFDDRLQVTRRARMLGYKVFSVDYNNF